MNGFLICGIQLDVFTIREKFSMFDRQGSCDITTLYHLQDHCHLSSVLD